MEFLKEYLPKDLINIIEDYSKNNINYEKCLREYEKRVIKIINITSRSMHVNMYTFNDLKIHKCYNLVITEINICNEDKLKYYRFINWIKAYKDFTSVII